MASTDSDPWEQIVKREDFQKSIRDKGYYGPYSFQSTLRELGLNVKGRTASWISLDFWSKQPEALKKANCYVIRIGQYGTKTMEGRFIIFSMDQFDSSYLDLEPSLHEAKELPIKEPDDFEYLKDAFLQNIKEDAAIEQLRFLGVYDELIKELFNVERYHIGPRGNRRSQFPVFFKRNGRSEPEKIFDYNGQEELDYTIWSENAVLVFEAKLERGKGGLDIGWHKLAYPLPRFRNYRNLKVIPVYFLRKPEEVLLFVFDQFKFHENGIILNDKQQFKPKVFRVVLSNNRDRIPMKV